MAEFKNDQEETKSSAINKGITALICTYNGASRLPRTLAYLASQQISPDISWEILVIDNASNDNSAEVANLEWNKYNLPHVSFRVLKERNPGKINALQLGFCNANYKYCVICDDDNWLDKDYLLNVYKVLEQNPNIGAVGGQSIAATDNGILPDWFQTFADGYAVGKQGEQSGDVTSRGHLWGAGMGTRTDVYKEIYKYVPSLLVGRSGQKLTAGEDSEYCQRLILKNFTLYYESSLTFIHYMPANRLTLKYKDQLFSGLSESNKIIEIYGLAIKSQSKANKNILNKFRLFAVTKLRLLFADNLEQKQKEKHILTFISPARRDDNSVAGRIKKFIET